MARYAIDTDVLGRIQRARFAAKFASLGLLPIVVTDVVWDELTVGAQQAGAHATTVNEAESLLKAIAGTPTVIDPLSPEGQAYARLRAGQKSENAGEHSLIAYAYCHPDVTAVLFDKVAIARGVEELKGRVLSFHGFLDRLRTEHGLLDEDARALSSAVCKATSLIPPLWW